MSMDNVSMGPPNPLWQKPKTGDQGFRLTGWHAFGILVAFFGVILLANGALVYNAATTWTGLEASKAHAHGLKWNEELARAEEQASRHWQTDLHISKTGDVAIRYIDADGLAAPVAAVEVHYRRPVNATEDQRVAASQTGSRWQASPDAPLAPGLWDFSLTARDADGNILHQGVKRMILKQE